MLTKLAQPNEALTEAAATLKSGDLVAFPTETVYGLGADARSNPAVLKIYEAKGRPSGNPIIVHVADAAAARELAGAKWSARAEKLAAAFWPGPLSMIVPRGEGISAVVSAGRETVALRAPAHRVAQALLREFGGPIAAPSANRSGFTSPTTAQHVLAELGGRIPLIVDGGACAVGVESTVIDLSGDVPRILRPGAVTAAMLEEVIGPVEKVQAVVREEDAAASPGQHSRHYAPRTPAYRVTREEWARCGPNPVRFAAMLASSGKTVALITHNPAFRLPAPHETMLLPAEVAAYAQKLYASLRAADELRMAAIIVLAPDDQGGLWAAVHDRLGRATLPFADLQAGNTP